MYDNQINDLSNMKTFGSFVFACIVVGLFYLCIYYFGPDPEFHFCKSGRCYCENADTDNRIIESKTEDET